MAKIKLLKFGATWCGPCKNMAKNKVIERFSEAHPDVEIKLYDLPGEEEADKLEALGEAEDPSPDLKPFYEAEEAAQDHDVEHLPTVLFEDEDGEELARSDEAMNLLGLEKLYKQARKAAE